MDDIEISNGEVFHGAGRDQVRHPVNVRCGRCPASFAPQPLSKTYRVRFEESGPDTVDACCSGAVQEASGSAETVAAFLRTLAEQLAPTRPVTRGRGMVPEPDPVQAHIGGFNVLPRPTP